MNLQNDALSLKEFDQYYNIPDNNLAFVFLQYASDDAWKIVIEYLGKTVKYLNNITYDELDNLQIDTRKNGTAYAYVVGPNIFSDNDMHKRINLTADVTFEVFPNSFFNTKCRYNDNGKYMLTSNIVAQLVTCMLSVDN